jgi:hypothetical protein
MNYMIVVLMLMVTRRMAKRRMRMMKTQAILL